MPLLNHTQANFQSATGIVMKQVMVCLLMSGLLAGCSSPATRMADCRAQGVSKDACYAAEQSRQAAILSASEKQAMENAANAVNTDSGDSHKHKHR